jgi:hypothetical protein
LLPIDDFAQSVTHKTLHPEFLSHFWESQQQEDSAMVLAGKKFAASSCIMLQQLILTSSSSQSSQFATKMLLLIVERKHFHVPSKIQFHSYATAARGQWVTESEREICTQNARFSDSKRPRKGFIV